MEERILERVKKMLRLANDKAASEGERDNALRMVHNILAKYNMDMSQIDMDSGGKAEGEAREMFSFHIRSKQWMVWVCHAVAKLMFCEMYRSLRSSPGGQWTIVFIGKTSNIVTAQHMAEYVIASIRKEGARYSKGNAKEHLAFNEGAAMRIQERCKKLREEAEAVSNTQQSTGTALVLASVYRTERDANIALMQKNGVTLKKASAGRTSSGTMDARLAGARYGDTVQLHKQMK